MREPRQKLTQEILDQTKPEEIVLQGVAPDSPEGLYMTGKDLELRWVIVKGYAGDWAMYTHLVCFPDWMVARQGDKVCSEENIRNVIECTSEVMEKMRL